MKDLRRKIVCFMMITALCISISQLNVGADEFHGNEYEYFSCGIEPADTSNGLIEKTIPGSSICMRAYFYDYAYDGNGSTLWPRTPDVPIKYEWLVLSSEGGTINDIQLSGKDQEYCTINISRSAKVGAKYTIQFNGYYLGLEGKYVPVHPDGSTYSFTISSREYYINFDLPDNMEPDTNLTFRPTIIKKTVDGEEISEEAMNNIKVSSDDNDVIDLVNNNDGSYTITRKKDEYFSIKIYSRVYDEDDFFGESISKTKVFKWAHRTEKISFVNNGAYYNWVDPIELCLSKENLETSCDEFKLYNVVDGTEIELDVKDYDMKEAKSAVYFTISKEWLDKNISKDMLTIKCTAYRNSKAIGESIAYIAPAKKAKIDLSGGSIKINTDYVLNSYGKAFFVGMYNLDGSYVYSLDSAKSSDTNVLQVSKDADGWKYRGVNLGKADLTVAYHYYKDGKRFSDEKTVNIDVVDGNGDISLPDDDRNNNVRIEKYQNISLFNDPEGNNVIELNVYWNVSGGICDNWFAKISFEGEEKSDRYYPIVLNGSNINTDYNYYTTVNINPGELSKKMKVQLISNTGKMMDEFTTSVDTYVQKILKSTNAEYEKYKPTLMALLNYGAAIQQYFGVNTDSLANKGLSSEQQRVENIPTEQLYRYNETKKINVDGIHYYGSSLVLGDTLKVRHYFTLDDDRKISNYSFETVSQIWYVDVEPHKSGDKYYIEINECGRNFYDKVYVKVSNGNMSGKIFYSPINYISKAYLSGNIGDNMKQLLNSLYWFEYQKAELNKSVS